ncbi:MAG: hypothetical protein FWE47_01110 [Oscillospiraceae bacterium]|nr:hypothetical protein [Oscillospiraceae bacterium]
MNKTLKIILLVSFGIALAILACLPYLNNYYVQGGGLGRGDDVYYHAPRLLALAMDLKYFNIPFDVARYFNNGFGMSFALFYPQFFLTIPAALIALGLNAMFSYKIFVFLLTFATLAICYLTGKKMLKSDFAAICFAIIYTFATYRLGDIYHRFAIGEVQAITFFPLFIYAIYNIFYEDGKRWYWLPISFFCVLNSHTLSAVFMVMAFAVFLIINIKSSILDKSTRNAVLIGSAFCALVSLSFALPYLEQLSVQKLNIPNPWSNGNDLSLRLTGFFNNYMGNRATYYGVGIGLGVLMLAFVSVFFKKEKEKFFIHCWLLAIGFYLFASQAFNWDDGGILFKLFGFVQFPYRFWLIILPLACIPACYPLKFIKPKHFQLIIILALVVNSALTIYPLKDMFRQHSYQFWEFRGTFSEDGRGTPNTLAGEFLPVDIFKYTGSREASGRYAYGDNFAVNQHTDEQYATKLGKWGHKAQISNAGETTIIMPIIYYKGYKAWYNGKRVPIGRSNMALVTVSSDFGQSGELIVRYVPTFIQTAARLITYPALLYLLWLTFRRRKS